MDNENKKNEPGELSPIRELFRQNEEAYNKHHREVEEQKKVSENETPRPEIPTPDYNEPKLAEQQPEVNNTPEEKKKGIKGLFQRLHEIITQPEDYSFSTDDEVEEFKDIFSAEEPDYLNKYKEKADDGLPEIIDEPEPVKKEELYASETVLFSAVSDDEGDEVVYDEKPSDTKQNDEKQNEDNPEKKAEPSEPVKFGISLNDILKAKNSAAVGSLVTINAPLVGSSENTVSNDDNKEDISVKSVNDQKDETPVKADELSHDKQEVTPVKTDELSHDKQNVTPVKADELSHDKQEVTPVKADELSHDKQEVTSVKADELSHDKQEVTPVKTDELSHDKQEVTLVKTDELSHDKQKKTVIPPPPKVDELSHQTDVISAPNFTERKNKEPMVYHHYNSKPFIVMAGKFTKTVRGEYENIRRIKGITPPSPPDKPKITKQPSPPKAETKVSEKTPEKPKKAEIKSSEKQPIKFKGKKKFSWKKLNIFAVDDDSFDDEDEFIEKPPEIVDYDSPEEASAIKNDINSTFSKVFARTIILCFTSVFSIILAVLNQLLPEIFRSWIHNGWLVYGIANFILFAVSVFAERYTIANGLLCLRHVKGNSDTAVAMTSLAAAIQAVTAIFSPGLYVSGTYHLYVCLAITALLFNSFGKLLIIKRTADNFRFLQSKQANFAGKIFTDSVNADNFVNGMPVQRPIIAYSKRSEFMSNFLHLSNSSDPVEDSASYIAPFAAILSILTGIVYGILNNDFFGAASSFVLTSFITAPLCCLIAINIPLKNLCSSTLKKGAMVAGYESVRQFSDTNAVMIDYTDLYPKENIILAGVRAANESKMRFALEAAAAVTFAVKGSMSNIFETIIQDRINRLPQVDSVSYEEKKGLKGWIGTQRILLGNRELLEKHNITIPDDIAQTAEKYHNAGNEINYISISGELIAIFILTYKVDREIADLLRELTENGVNIIVRTIDQNVTAEKIANDFHILRRCVNVLTTGMGNVCHKELCSKEKTTRAYVVTNGRISALASAIVGCIKVNAGVKIANIIQMISVVMGFFAATGISMISGFAKLGNIEALLYTVFWCGMLILLSAIARKLTS